MPGGLGRILQTILMMARQRYHIFGEQDGCSKKSKNPFAAWYAAIARQTYESIAFGRPNLGGNPHETPRITGWFLSWHSGRRPARIRRRRVNVLNLVVQQGCIDEFSEFVKRLAARRVSPVMARPCQEAQHRGRPLHDSPEGSYSDDPIRRCSPRKGDHSLGLRLVLHHLGSSESINTTLLDH